MFDTEIVTESAPTPEPSAAPAEAAPAAPKPGKADRKQSIKEQLKARLARSASNDDGDDAPVPAPAAKPAASPPAPTAKAEAVAAKIEEAGGEVPEQRPGESDAKYELKLAQTLRKLRDVEQEAARVRKAHEESSAELDKFKKRYAKGKESPLDLLKEHEWTFEDLVKAINEDKVKVPEKDPAIPDWLREKIERLDRLETERENERKQAEQRGMYESDVKTVATVLEKHADKFPLAAAFKGAAKQVVDAARAEGTNDIGPILEALEARLAEDVTTVLASEKSVKAALAKNPDLRKVVMAALGVSDAPAAPAKAAAPSMSAIPTEAPQGEPVVTNKRERAAVLKAQLAARLRARADEDNDD